MLLCFGLFDAMGMEREVAMTSYAHSHLQAAFAARSHTQIK